MSGQRLSVGEVMKAVGQDELFYRNSEGGVTFGGGEPTAGGDFLLGLMESSQARGYHVCLDTCGLAPEPFFRQALALSDLLLFDLKHMDPDAHLELTGAGNQAILSNLGLALSSKAEVRIRMPLMPGLNDSEENIGAMADFLRPLGKDEVEVMPNHAFGRGKYLALNLPPPDIPAYRPEELKEALGRFKKLGLKTAIV
jgi:pyruvate formate lyase activating enzyme